MSIEALAPILPRLEELELRIANTDMMDDDINLRARCQNLRRLHILWDTSFEQNSLTWARLEDLSIGDNVYISHDTFIDFMQNNPQLKRLKFGAECEVKLHNIGAHLPNLEQLTIFQNYSNLSPETLHELKHLERLKRIALRNVAHSHFDEVLNSLTKLKNLIDVRIQAEFDQFSDDDIFQAKSDSILSLATKMPQLEVFGISFATIKVQTFIDFIQFAEHLQEIHVHDCGIDLRPQLIKQVVDTRKTIKGRVDPLKLFVDYVDEDDVGLTTVSGNKMFSLEIAKTYML